MLIFAEYVFMTFRWEVGLSQKVCKESSLWWKKTVVYQIYPRSFYDSNKDGIGDLPGIINKLDYLNDLGVETLWISPFFAGPGKDFGYDVTDYFNVSKDYGNLEDCFKLIREVHRRKMKIVFDLVLNHTSDQHPWFLESKSSKDNSKRDYYVWRKGKKNDGQTPPNNWKSMVGGSGWHYDKSTNEWYWSQFLPFQPDLNYRNPEVREKMLGVLRFWLDQGVDGFRLDIINALFEDESLRDNPFSFKYLPSEDHPAQFFQEAKYSLNQEETLSFMKDVRSLVDGYRKPERFTVGEVMYAGMDTLKGFTGEDNSGLHLVFLFQSLDLPLRCKEVAGLLRQYEKTFKEPNIPTLVFGNHDRFRRASKLGKKDNIAKAKLNALLQLTARGVPFIYQGEEVGMLNHHLPYYSSHDPFAKKYKLVPQFIFDLLRRLYHFSVNRDECRTPMQWDDEVHGGFCSKSVKPWLPLSKEHKIRNVKVQEKDPQSLLSNYKKLLKLRKFLPQLCEGREEIIENKDNKNILILKRYTDSEDAILIIFNFSEKFQILKIDPLYRSIFSTQKDISSNVFGPWEGKILVEKSSAFGIEKKMRLSLR